MGLNLHSTMVIQGNGDNIVCEPYGQHKETGKWAGAINLYKEGYFHTTVVSSEPDFDTSDDAVNYMKRVVEKVREINIGTKRKQLEEIVGKEEMGVVGKIVNASKKE